ncbi:CDP-alcohol phosphatidyltransferase family protein [Polyangium sorediatum]|uniref:CDP-alcohol phosphatidyltransferase family protein n=1 Tax=Polyangium sorediatum TaxID=889274 RepID=A0ABT6P113_9BACT|nr:CDP-alcohol phosphatidyltransferase family protein [Polyangium sorediatum]MDI1434221.1 CDP-alcohol phosphatidyltransferase family protein [Polyangium sorediatum]
MSQYRLADLGLLPNVLSALRLPLAAVFPFVVDDVRAALAVLFAAALTDVLDGWLARRRGQLTAVGAVVDPIADKVFAVTVVVTLLYTRRMPAWAPLALLSREILEAPLLAWVLMSPRFRGARRAGAQANVPGKLATCVQFVAVVTAITAPHLVEGALVASACVGTLAGVSYWTREIERARRLAGGSPRGT